VVVAIVVDDGTDRVTAVVVPRGGSAVFVLHATPATQASAPRIATAATRLTSVMDDRGGPWVPGPGYGIDDVAGSASHA